MDLEKLQVLNEMIKYAKSAPFYRDILPDQIQSYADFTEFLNLESGFAEPFALWVCGCKKGRVAPIP